MTELGDIELSVPRTRRYGPTEALRAYARRSPEIDQTILRVSCSAFHPEARRGLAVPARPVGQPGRLRRSMLKGRYEALVLDGVGLAPAGPGRGAAAPGAGGFRPAP